MAETEESGMQIVTISIELANQAMKAGREAIAWTPRGCRYLEHHISNLRELVDCLDLVSKSVFEHDKGGYLTATLFPFLLQRPPRRPNFTVLCDLLPPDLAAQELEKSEILVDRLLGLLCLISLNDTFMSLPPRPHPKFTGLMLDNVAVLLERLGIKKVPFVAVEEQISTRGQVLVSFLLKLLREGNLYDKLISVMALGAIAQQSGQVEHLVEAVAVMVPTKILKEGPMLLQAEAVHLICNFVAIDPTIQDKLPLRNIVGSLVSRLQLMAVEEHYQDGMSKTTLVFSAGSASHNSNRRTIADDGNERSSSGKKIQLLLEDSSLVKARMIAMVTNLLRLCASHNPSLCWIVVDGVEDVAFSMRCLGIEEVIFTTEGKVQVSLILKFFREGGLYDKLISVMALGVITKKSRKVKHLLEAGVTVLFNKILKEGPMVLQAEVAHVMSKCMAVDPTFRNKLPLDDLISSLVSLLQVEVAEEHFQDNINNATSVLSIVAARHNSNRRKAADDQNEKSRSGEQNKLQLEETPGIKARMKVMAANILGALAKDNASVCQIIVEKRAILCFAVLLQSKRLDVKLSSAMALMEITAVAEKETDLRRSGFKHSSYAHKTVVDQLMRIMGESSNGTDVVQSVKQISSTPKLLIPCIKAIGNLATTFRGTRPVIPLVHLLESSNCEVVKETLVALTKFTCRDTNFLHLDHSKAIVSLGGLNPIVLLTAHESIMVQKHAFILLCYIAIDAVVNESDGRQKVLSVINIAVRKSRFLREENMKELLQQAKRRLA